MSGHRRSFAKTVFGASVVALVAGLALTWLGRDVWLNGGSWSRSAWLVHGACTLAIGGILGFVALVIAGGLIALHRDTSQATGHPYAYQAPREWVPGVLVQMARRAARSIVSRLDRTPGRLRLRPGELVEIKSLEDIIATLDVQGTLQSLPFMPEMAAFCGRQARVLRRVDKINDYVWRTGLRRVRDTVLLEQLRCSGIHHGGCQASCHLLWKEAWLTRPSGEVRPSQGGPGRKAAGIPAVPAHLSADELVQLARRTEEDGSTRYVCQMTQVAEGTTPLHWGDPRHYLRDLLTGNVRLAPFFTGVSIALFNWVQRQRQGAVSPARMEIRERTSPHEALALQPGDRVRVKAMPDIERTLNHDSRNRGLWFDRDLIRFCGGEYRVHARVNRIINERTGKLVTLSIPNIILEGVTATGEYLAFCPQNDAIFWREIWLQRVEQQGDSARPEA